MKRRLFTIILSILAVVVTITAQERPQYRGMGQMQKPKFIFLFIGDGMGFAQVSLAEAYLAAQKGEISNHPLSFTTFPNIGMVTTFSSSNYITCSSASGTAMSTGFKTNNGMLGVDPQEIGRAHV